MRLFLVILSCIVLAACQVNDNTGDRYLTEQEANVLLHACHSIHGRAFTIRGAEGRIFCCNIIPGYNGAI